MPPALNDELGIIRNVKIVTHSGVLERQTIFLGSCLQIVAYSAVLLRCAGETNDISWFLPSPSAVSVALGTLYSCAQVGTMPISVISACYETAPLRKRIPVCATLVTGDCPSECSQHHHIGHCPFLIPASRRHLSI